MTHRQLVRLLIAQTVLMVGLGWAAVYLGRDEFRLAVGREEEGLPSPSLLADDEAGPLPAVRLNAIAQRHAGVELQRPTATTMSAGTTAGEITVTVLDPQPLAELRTRLRAAQQEAAASHATAVASRLEQARIQALFDDDRSASQRALEAANAQALTDAARERTAQSQSNALRDGARAAWGAVVASWFDAPDGAVLQRVLSGREVLLRAVLRADDIDSAPTRLQATLPGRREPVTAQALGAISSSVATASANPGAEAIAGGRHLLFKAPGAGLAPGMRLTARLHRDGADAARAGGLVPASAVIWHAGQAWIYVREAGGDANETDDKATEAQSVDVEDLKPARAASTPDAVRIDRFQRRAIPNAMRLGDQWFVPGIETDDPVVVRGAQLLLSEELKSQIKNENDD
ncbi:MAG: hypothetical protein QFE16_03420 [Pseudomonadota bacterium]|nr:hypothetical protein [Pseudomonadota bacterium]